MFPPFRPIRLLLAGFALAVALPMAASAQESEADLHIEPAHSIPPTDAQPKRKPGLPPDETLDPSPEEDAAPPPPPPRNPKPGMPSALAPLPGISTLTPPEPLGQNAKVTHAPATGETKPAPRGPWVAIAYEVADTDTGSAFVESALNGGTEAKEELRVAYVGRRIDRGEDREQALRQLCEKGYKLIVAVGYQMVPAVISLADKFPETRFTVIDGMVPPLFNNVQSVIFKDHEGAFLVGMLAAYATRTKTVGFIGGMDVPLIRNFAVGYEQGVHYVDSTITILTDTVGAPGDAKAWGDPARAETLARKMYGRNADVIFAAAGSSGIGILKVAKETGRLAIGVDSNQNYLYPGSVLTSMVKRLDRAVFDTIRDAKEQEWRPGIKTLGIREDALDYSVDRNNRALISQTMIDALENAKDLIIRGSKTVEAYQP